MHKAYTLTSTGKTAKSKKQHPSAGFSFSLFPLLFHLPLSLWQQAWSHLSNPTTNTHTHSAGTYTVSELQRHPAAGVGVHFLKLWFPSAYKCYRRTEKLTTLVSCTRKLFMEGCNVEEDFHRCGRTVISSPEETGLQVQAGNGTTRKNGKRKESKYSDEDIKKRSKEGSPCPTELTSWLPEIRERGLTAPLSSLSPLPL